LPWNGPWYTVSVDEIRDQKGRVLLEAFEAEQLCITAKRNFDTLVGRMTDFLTMYRSDPATAVARGETAIPTPHEIIETAKRLGDAQEKKLNAEKKKTELGLT
jgi:hypothetical protein